MHIARSGYTSQTSATFPLTAGEVRFTGTIALVPANAAVTGTIVNSVTTSPLAGITVTASPVAGGVIPSIGHQQIVREAITQPTGATTTTNGSGAFTLSVSPGTYNFTFSGTGYVAKTIQSVTLSPGGSLPSVRSPSIRWEL